MNFTRTQIETDVQCKIELLGRLDIKRGYEGSPTHRHPFFEVFYISKGTFDVQFENECQTVSRGDVFVIAPNVQHKFSCAETGEMLYIGISFFDATNARYPVYYRPNNADVSETLERISYATAKKGACALRKSVYELLPKLTSLILAIPRDEEVGMPDALSEKIKSFLRLHLCDNVTVKDIAGAFYMNPHYLGEYFKKHNGISIKDYLLDQRMHKAFALLKEGKMTVSRIAETVGFDTVQYFSTKFKEYYGISPAKYIEKLKGKQKL